MSDIILHHYPQSPVSEKIRTAMGMKNLTWRSVEQNRLPDRPELLAMTGGYRRIPVMQLGAEIFCDTQCILMALEHLYTEPTLFPGGGAGMPFALSRWTDGMLFELAVRLAFAPVADQLPAALMADRSRLYFGAHGDMAKEREDLPHTLAQLRVQLGWLDERLADGRHYLPGDQPGMPDLLGWSVIWFITQRYEHAVHFLSEFESLIAWSERMRNIGHGQYSAMTPNEALTVAREQEPTTEEQSDPRDPQHLVPGESVCIGPLGDTGEVPVCGRVHAVSRHRLAIWRTDPLCGDVIVHFPRAGYRVARTG